MGKATIKWLSLSALAILLVGMGLLIFSLVFEAQWEKTGPSSYTAQPESLGVGFYTAITLLVVSGLVFLVAWIGALIRAATMQDWVWLVLLLVFSGIATLVYGFAAPETMPPWAMPRQPPTGAMPMPPPERTPTAVG